MRAATTRSRRPASSWPGPSLKIAPDSALPGPLERGGSDCDVPGREAVRLEEDDVLVGCPSDQVAADDLLQLVHLQPVEHADLDRLDQVAGLEPRAFHRIAADKGGPLQHDVVELSTPAVVGANRAYERPAPEPLAAQHRIGRRRRRADDVFIGRIAVAFTGLGADLPAERRERLRRAAVRDDPPDSGHCRPDAGDL